MTEQPPWYLVFFKGRDADVLATIFKEFSQKKLNVWEKPYIWWTITAMKEKAAAKNAEHGKPKNKERGIDL